MSLLLLTLLREAQALDNMDARRQAREIRDLSLLIRDKDYIDVFRLSRELIDRLEIELLPFLTTRIHRISNRIKVRTALDIYLYFLAYKPLMIRYARSIQIPIELQLKLHWCISYRFYAHCRFLPVAAIRKL